MRDGDTSHGQLELTQSDDLDPAAPCRRPSPLRWVAASASAFVVDHTTPAADTFATPRTPEQSARELGSAGECGVAARAGLRGLILGNNSYFRLATAECLCYVKCQLNTCFQRLVGQAPWARGAADAPQSVTSCSACPSYGACS